MAAHDSDDREHDLASVRLGRTFFSVDAATLARRLLGRHLVRHGPDGERLAGVVVETEAYLGVIDRASHAFGGRRTTRNEAMYAGPGTAYVYFTYGMHFCANVVCAGEGDPQAVLIRALRPVRGLESMRARRSVPSGAAVRDVDLCRGPARLCRAMAVDRELNGHDLVGGAALWFEEGAALPDRLIRRSARVGVEYAGTWAARRLRWFVEGELCVSGRANPRGAGLRTGGGTLRPARLSLPRSQS